MTAVADASMNSNMHSTFKRENLPPRSPDAPGRGWVPEAAAQARLS